MQVWSGAMEIESIYLQRENLAIFSSNLTGNIWNGCLSITKYEDGVINAAHVHYFNTGLRNGLWHSGKLYVSTDEGLVAVYSSELQLIYSTLMHHDSVNSMHKKGKQVISCDDLDICLYDEELKVVSKYRSNKSKSLIWADDSSFLCGNSSEIIRHDVRTQEKHQICKIPELCLKFASCENSFFAAGESAISEIDLRAGIIRSHPVSGIISTLAVKPQKLVIGTEVGDIITINTASQETSRIKAHLDSITSLILEPTSILSSSLDKTIIRTS